MSVREVSAEKLAELFHHYHQVLGPDFGCPNDITAESWEHMSQQEKSRCIAAGRLALLEIASDIEDSKRYFAKPGQAQWGC